jgi:hypothetical protein
MIRNMHRTMIALAARIARNTLWVTFNFIMSKSVCRSDCQIHLPISYSGFNKIERVIQGYGEKFTFTPYSLHIIAVSFIQIKTTASSILENITNAR